MPYTEGVAVGTRARRPQGDALQCFSEVGPRVGPVLTSPAIPPWGAPEIPTTQGRTFPMGSIHGQGKAQPKAKAEHNPAAHNAAQHAAQKVTSHNGGGMA